MKRLDNLSTLSTLSTLPALALALVLALVSNIAAADQRHNGRRPDFKSGHDKGNYQPSSRSRHWNHQPNRYSAHGRAYPDQGHRFGSAYYPGHYYRPDNHWSVSVNLGSPYSRYNSTYYSSFYSNTNSFYPPVRHQTQVIYKQPKVVYVVNEFPANTGHEIHRSAESGRQSNLLRDINGFCFERNYDKLGNEIRTQLPDSACRF